jgi:hypothetical protein
MSASRSAKLLGLTLFIVSASAHADDSFIEATATFKGGVVKSFKCQPAGPSDNKYQPTAATPAAMKEYSFNLMCLDAPTKSFFGISFKIDRSGPATAVIPSKLSPFPDGSKAPRGKAAVLERLSNVFTVKASLGGTPRKELNIHSFPQLPQHYTEAQATITAFRHEKDAADGKFYNYVSGEGSAKFVEKTIDSRSNGEEGSLVWKFQNVKTSHNGPK